MALGVVAVTAPAAINVLSIAAFFAAMEPDVSRSRARPCASLCAE